MADRKKPSGRRNPRNSEPDSSTPETKKLTSWEDREEVAAREAGIYDEVRGSTSRSGAESSPPEPASSSDWEIEEPRGRGRSRRRGRRAGAGAEAEAEEPAEREDEDEEDEDGGAVDWWDEIEEEVESARGEEDAASEEEAEPAREPEPRPEPEPEPEEDGFALGIFDEPDPEPVTETPVAAEPEPEPELEPEPDPVPAALENQPAAEHSPPESGGAEDEEEDEDEQVALPDSSTGVAPRWLRETWAKAAERHPERREEFRTTSGLAVAPLYGPSLKTARGFDDHVGYPGEFPFTRGVQPTMYRGRIWTMRQYAGFASAAATNERFRYLLEQGQTGLSAAFDLPTQIGYDSDDERSAGEVGKVGVPINSLRDMERLLEGIPLDKVSLSMTINSTALILVLMVAAVAKKQGVPLEAVRGTVQNDMLKEFVARNTYRFSLDAHMRLVTDLFRYCGSRMPKFNMISISGYHMREAGCTAAQEIAFTLANGIAYVEAAVGAGMKVDDFAGRLSFFFAAHNNLFEEVAKFRAARRMWARVMKDRFGAAEPGSMALRFHTQTAGSTLTAAQPLTNVPRVTLQALAAVLGGTQSLHTNSFDEALGLPAKDSALLALRTQQVIAHESGVTDTVDPLGGCPFVEELTDDLEARALSYLAKIEEMGGTLDAIRSGWMKDQIEASAYQAQKEIESGDQVVVGVNEYRIEDEAEPRILTVDEEQAASVLADLGRLKVERDGRKADAALAALEISAAWGDVELPDLILNCVEAYCTIGEICRSLEGVLRDDREG